MRYLLIIAVIFSLFIPTYAQNLDSLKLVYEDRMLSLQIRNTFWTPFLGYNEISEEILFSIAGFSENVRMIRARKKSGQNTLVAGIVIAVGGGILFINSGEKKSVIQEEGVGFLRQPPPINVTEEGNKGLRMVGFVGVIAGSFMALSGHNKMSSKWASKERAKDLVRVYNKKLKKELGLKPNK